MLKDDKNKIPEVFFTFKNESENEEELKNKLKALIDKRNELLISKGIDIQNNKVINIKEKMESGIIGFVIGDAFGVPFEFLSSESLKNNNIIDMGGYKSHNVPEGTWSDDTSLMIAAMDSIQENGTINFKDIMYKFTEWIDYAKYTSTDKLFDIGMSTSMAIANFKKGVEATNCGTRGLYENGNGSLMRILPFVYYLKYSDYSEKERTTLINQASSLTHAHEISCLGCKIYADYVTLLLDGIDKLKALELLKQIDYSKYYSSESLKCYERILKGDLKSLSIDEIKSSGYVVDSLEASIWCTLKSNTYEEAVVTAVNLGEDTDTIGAITGSINGIIYGKNSIPERWLNKLRRKEYLESLTNLFINNIYSQKQNKTLRNI